MAISITLADDTVLDNLEVNGSYYITTENVDASVFVDNCSPMSVSVDGEVTVHENAELVSFRQQNGENWFAFRDIPAAELAIRKLKGDLDFLAMMTDVYID